VGKDTQELRSDIEQTREDLGETLDAIGERVSPRRVLQRRTERVRNAFSSMRVSVMGSAESVSGSAHQAREQAGSAVTSVAETAQQAPQQVLRQTEGNPLAAGLVAFGFGLVVASVLPATKPEQQAAEAVQDQVEPLKERATEAAQQVKDEVEDAARSAAEQVKERATEAAGEVRGQAQSSADQVKSQAKSAAAETKDRAEEGAQRTREP
jgi:uncharacterized protein YjbJ (UPF0337 family)